MEVKPIHYSFILLTTFLVGLYFGIFFGEATVIYQCERDKRIHITGALWKDGIVYQCQAIRTINAEGDKQ